MFKFTKKCIKETSNNKPSFHLKINLSSSSFFNKAYSNLSIALNILIGVKSSLPNLIQQIKGQYLIIQEMGQIL